MAIGRAEDRDTPWDPVMFNIARMFRSPIRVTHLGQRSDRPHTQAGHMTAIDQTCFSCVKSLHARGPSTHGSRLSPGLRYWISGFLRRSGPHHHVVQVVAADEAVEIAGEVTP